MFALVLQSILGGCSVLLLPHLISGIRVNGFKAAWRLVIAIMVINTVLRLFFWWFIIPFKILTLGIGTILVNGVVLDLASDFVDGISVESFTSALYGGIGLSVIWSILDIFLS
ncbi:MAG: phage holin family protein [Candidatus Riflebacteria bacterium]|nr:phage holin family protein [Candidatus Riflebacteria bacterium]